MSQAPPADAAPPELSAQPLATGQLAWTLVRLRYALYRAHMDRSIGATVGLAAGVLVGGMVLVTLVATFVALRGAGLGGASLTVVILAPLALLWPTSALIFGSDSALEPRRFATLPVPPDRLAVGLLAAGLSGIPSLFLLAASLGQVIPWTTSLATAGAALVSAVLAPATVVLATRALLGALARLMRTSKGRAVGAIATGLIGLAPVLLSVTIMGGSPSSGDELDARHLAEIISATPVGWAWALPYDLATGRPGRAIMHALLAVALLGVLWWFWRGRVRSAVTQPPFDVGAGRVRERADHASAAVRPAWMTIARRRVLAWRRDPRLLTQAVSLLSFPVVTVGFGLVAPDGLPAMGIGLVFAGLASGAIVGSELAYDGSAWWLDLSIGVTGQQDRLGRLAAIAVIEVPAFVLLTTTCVLLGLMDDPWPWITVALAAVGASLAVGLVLGAVHPGVAPRQGDSPFSTPPGSTGIGCLLSLVALIGPAVLVTPFAVAVWATAATVPASVMLVAAIGYAVGLVAVGVIVGGRLLERRAPELLATLVDLQK